MEPTKNYARHKILLSVLALAVFIWGVLGALDIPDIGYSGYMLSADASIVTDVREGSPAERAGLKVGDTVTQIDGIPIEDFAAIIDRRPVIDGEGSLTVTRNGASQTLNFKYESRPLADTISTTGIFTLTGLAFLILGLLVYLKNPTRLSTHFCSFGLLFAISVFNAPYLATATQRRIVNAVLGLLFAMLLATMLDYCLHFPKAKQVITKHPTIRQLIYLVAAAWGAMWATIFITNPPMSTARLSTLSIVDSVIIGGYVLLAVLGLIHTCVKASAQERRASGLNIMAGALAIGFGPVLIAILLRLIFPHAAAFPGEQFVTVTFVVIPIGLAMALMRLEPAPAPVKAPEPAA